jgi:hypothetical protein
VVDPHGVALATQLRGSLPGRVEVEFPLSLPGLYRIAVETHVGDRPVRVQERGLSWDYPEELRFRPADTALLKSIAAASGGRYDPRAEDVWRRSGPRVPYTMPLWPALVATALVLLAVDVRLKRG